MMIAVIFLVLVTFLIIDYILDKRFFSPVKIFNAVWIVIFGLYQLKLSYLQDDFTDTALWVFLICILVFDTVCLIYNILSKRRDKNRESTTGQKDRILAWYKPKFSVDEKLKVVNIVFVILFIVEIIYSKKIPLVSLLAGGDSEYLEFGIPSLNGLMYGVAICTGAYYIYKKNPRALIYLLFGALVVSRQLLISMILEAIIVFGCRRIGDKHKIKHIFLKIMMVLVAFIMGFSLFGNFRSGSDVMQRIFEPREEYKNLPMPAMWLYSYTEFSFSNFNNLTKKTEGGVNHGLSIAKRLLPSAITNNLNIKTNFDKNYLIKPNFTVSTWFSEIYLDFGIIGVAIFSALIALLGSVLYKYVLKNNSIENSLLYALFLHNILMFFFINMFLYLPVISQAVFIPMLFRGKEKEKE